MALVFLPQFCVAGGKAFAIEQLVENTFVPDDALPHSASDKGIDSRLIALINAHANEIRQCSIVDPVYLLLPSISNREKLQKIMAAVMVVLPGLSSAQVSVYPYGSASFLMAMNNLLRNAKSHSMTWILAANVSENSSIEAVSSDSFVLARCLASDEGLVPSNLSIDLELGTSDNATNNIVKQLGSACQRPLTDISLSCFENQEPPWLNAIQFMSPWVKQDSNYHLIDAILGPLGACGGLIKAMCFCYRQQAKPNESFNALQIDVEPLGYNVGALFHWCTE